MITSLTKEQEAKFPEYVKMGLDIGLRTTRIDKQKATEAINFFYNSINMKTPEIKFVSSPLEANKLINKLKGNKTPEFYYDHISNLYISYYVNALYLGKEVVTENTIVPLLEKYLDCFKEIHSSYLFDTVCIVSDFPTEINMKDGRLHKDGGPSVRYSDGFCTYSLNGISVTKEVAEVKAKDITKDMIIKETNADIRRELIRKLTSEQLISVLDSKVIDKKTFTITKKVKQRKYVKVKEGRKLVKKLKTLTKKVNQNLTYELLSISVDGDRERPFLKMENPSLKGVFHVEGVRPEIKTVEEALKYRNGLSEFSLPEAIS